MKNKIKPEEYSSILKSLNLSTISLSEGNLKVFECESEGGGTINLKFKDKYSFSDSDDKVHFVASFVLDGLIGEDPDVVNLRVFTLSGKFDVVYTKDKSIEISKDFFDVFKDLSLAIVVWPYYREFIQNMVVRSGLPSFTLPARIFESIKK